MPSLCAQLVLDTTRLLIHSRCMAPRNDLKPIGWSADRVGVSVQTLRNWANAGRVPYVRLPSGQMRFLVSDLDAMIQRVEATEPTAAKAS
jgi:hypothetical protein